MRRAFMQWLVIVPLGACTVDNDDGDPFASGTAPTTINPTTTVDPTTGDSSGSTGGSTAEDDESTAAMTTSGSTGMDSLDSSSGGSSEGTNDPTGNGMQPADGMYSHCVTAEECGFNPILCITVQDNTDGFCSETGCLNPAVDCAASPGGTAVPRCMPTTIDEMELQACALDCSGGMTCPAPMICLNLTDIGEICV